MYHQAAGNWYIRTVAGRVIAGGGNPIAWGWRDAVGASADFDGDGTTDVAVFNTADGYYYIRRDTSPLWIRPLPKKF